LEGELLGVGPICEPVGVGASIIVRSGPLSVAALRKVLGLCFVRGHGDIEGWPYLVEEASLETGTYRGRYSELAGFVLDDCLTGPRGT